MFGQAAYDDEYIPYISIFDNDGQQYSLADITSESCNAKTGDDDECDAYSCLELGFEWGNFSVLLDIEDPEPGEDPNFPNGFGFNDKTEVVLNGSTLEIGEIRKIVLCQVLTDVSHLIQTSQNLCKEEEMPTLLLKVTSDSNSNSTALASATPFYFNFTNLTVAEVNAGQTPSPVHPDILYNSVWRYLNGGTNPFDFPFMNFDIPGIDDISDNTYHGALRVNFTQLSDGSDVFHYDLTTETPQIGGQSDFYSVLLHEVFHLLGVTSFINNNNNNGTIQGAGDGTLFTRYDTYLRDGNVGGDFFLNVDESQCYDIGLDATTLLALLNQSNSDLVFDGDETSIFGPLNLAQGGGITGRLSHLCSQCYGETNPYFLMNLFYVGTTRRPTEEEVALLCDLGYSTTGVFGDGSLASHVPDVNAPDIDFECGGTIVAGVDDPCGVGFEICLDEAQEINIEGLGINDHNVDIGLIANCFFVENGDGTIQVSNDGDFVTYTPGGLQYGWHVISYQARGDNDIFNTTFIYINVIST